jgi:hypothetical protein
MKALSVKLIISACCGIILSSCNNDSGTAKNSELPEGIVLGMVKEERNKLAGIPLASTPFGGTELPESIDLSEGMPEAGNQGGQQSCVAWAVAYALKSYQEKMELGEQMNFSPSFIYNQINNGQNVPTYITDALNVLSEQGVCFLNEMPYKEDDWKSKPSQLARQSAKRFRIDYWRQVNVQDVKEVKAQLHAGLPVIIGSEVSYEFVKEGLNNEDYIWKEKGKSAGGHAMLLVGYDDKKNAFKVMNSWGKEWGDNGFGWIDYELFPTVTWYGFVAKDAYTAPETIANKNSNQQTEDDKNYYNNDNYYQNQEINPRDNPNAFDTINFNHQDVQHNVMIEGDESKGKAMKITGSIDLPSKFGKKFQVAVHIYDAATNKQVKSLMYPDYADVDGFAAKATPLTDIGETGFRGTWWINIPYRAVDFPPGQSDFYAIPSLFVDNFGVAFGEPIKFWIRKTN